MDKAKNNNNKDEFEKQNDRIKLTVYKNGFCIDDGPFRDITEEKNKKFMDEVQKGFIPKELVDQGFKTLGIALEDKK
jgi:UBX domain-containing protein 1